MNNVNIYSQLGVGGFQEGAIDLLAIVRDSPRESYLTSSLPDNASSFIIIPADSFSFNVEQAPKTDTRFAGEGAESNTFLIPNISIKGTIKMPFVSPVIGYIDPALALLWDYCRLAYWGTAGVSKGRLRESAEEAESELIITNISEFLPVNDQAPVYAAIKEGDIVENIIITAANKTTCALTLLTGLEHSYTNTAEVIAVWPRMADIEREPAFSLVSMREGVLCPCLVDKLTIDIPADGIITVTVDIIAMNIQRNKQISLRSKLPDLFKTYSKVNRVNQILSGAMTKVTPASGGAGGFGLNNTIGDALFGGYQSLDLPYDLITGISLSIENNIEAVYSLHSLKKDTKLKRMENSYPYALYSQGRTISGSIKYRHSVDQFAFAERLSGPCVDGVSNRNGLAVECGGFKITIPELIWSPSTSDSTVDDYQNRSLNWTMVAQHFNSMPVLEYKLGV